MPISPRISILVPPVFILALAVCSAPAAPPQAGHDVRAYRLEQSAELTLGDVVDAALARDPRRGVTDAIAVEAEAMSAKAGRLLAGAPSVWGSWRDDRIGSDRGYREGEVAVEMPVWWPGQKRAGRSLADRIADERSASDGQLRWEVTGLVRQALWEVELARGRVRVADEALTAAQRQVDAIERRVHFGESPRADLVLARQDALEKRADQASAEAELHRAIHAYLRLTGLAAIPADVNEPRADRQAIEPDHPALLELNASAERARAEAELIRAGRAAAPTVWVGARRDRGTADEPFDNSVGVGISVPLGGAGYVRTESAAAERAAAEAMAARDQQLRELTQQLEAAEMELFSTAHQLELAKEARGLAREHLRMSELAFAAGDMDFIDLLRVQASARAADLRATELEIRLRQQTALYNQAAGVIPSP